MIGTPAPLLAHQARPRAVELDLARGVRAVAELVLQPLEVERVLGPVRQHAREQEAGEPARRLGEDEEGVAHRRRAEPLVPGEPVLAAGAAAAHRRRPRRVRPDVRAALLLGERHADEGPRLLGHRAEPGIVGGRADPRQPFGGQLGLTAERRHRGVRHPDRTADARFDLAQEEHAGGPGDVGAGPRGAPGSAVEALAHGQPEQGVPGRVELHLVAPVPEAVEGVEHRRVAIGQHPPLEHLRLPQAASERRQVGLGPARPLPAHRLGQGPVGGVQVDVGERRRLVRDLVGPHTGQHSQGGREPQSGRRDAQLPGTRGRPEDCRPDPAVVLR